MMVYECELLNLNNGTAYIYGINLITAKNSSTIYTFYLYNAHGDVVQLVSGGTITKTYHYDAFGVEYSPSGSDSNYFRYCGEYFDKETGTYYLRARYYNPGNGRFTQQDGWEYANPGDPLTLNLYTYCHNNPIMYFDPNGTSVTDVMAGVVIALYESTTGLWRFIIETLFKTTVKTPRYEYESEYDYYLGRVIGDVLSIEMNIHKTIQGIKLLYASITSGAAITYFSGGLSIVVGATEICVTVAAAGVAVAIDGATATLIAAGNLSYDFGRMSNSVRTGNWGEGSFDSPEQSLQYHFEKHGAEVGAKDVDQYLRKAEAFSKNLKGAQKYSASGYTEGAVKYVKDGKYIILGPDKSILSFGKVIN